MTPVAISGWIGAVLPPFVAIVILFIGFRVLLQALSGSRKGYDDDAPMIAEVLCEKTDAGLRMSFSRVAGAIGAIGFAAFFSALGFWVLSALGQNLTTVGDAIGQLWKFFIAAAAFFFPYAVNQLSPKRQPDPPTPPAAASPLTPAAGGRAASESATGG
ncbi:MAG: hypothetical protein JXQ99_05665 [Hyphomicrobiaceae bacterium]